MTDAPQSILFSLFDGAAAVDGTMLSVFAREHPDAPAAFREWCKQRGHELEEREEDIVLDDGRQLCMYVLASGPITVHLNLTRKAA